MPWIWIYPTFVFMGGLIGFIKAGSTPSLIAGIVSSGLLFFATYLLEIKKENRGFILLTLLTLFLLVFFSYRFYLSQVFMPAGLMVILSLLQLGLLTLMKRKTIST